MAEQTPPPSPDAFAVHSSPRKRHRATTKKTDPPIYWSVGCAPVQVDDSKLTVDWASSAWDAPSYVDMLWRSLHGAPFPWAHYARAGIEYLTDPDTGKPDFGRTALYTRLYAAAHDGETPPWSEWTARDWT